MKKEIQIPLPIPAKFQIRNTESPNRVYLMLHGYMENGKCMWERFNDILPKDCEALSPNGPFPIPQGSPFKVHSDFYQFSWYFYNMKKNNFYIDYQAPLLFLKELIHQLQFDKIPMTIIGYSQGGYLGLLATDILKNVDHFIGINCSYRIDLLERPITAKVDALHGENDETVDWNSAQNHFKQLQSKGHFYTLPKEDHKITKPFIEKVKTLI